MCACLGIHKNPCVGLTEVQHLTGAKTPMQVIGIPALTARYGYTWRGIRRARDREHGIAGGEPLIYDLQTKEVLAVRRQFLIASHNPRGAGKAMEVAASCSQVRAHPYAGEFQIICFRHPSNH